jgi:hypothetical protein
MRYLGEHQVNRRCLTMEPMATTEGNRPARPSMAWVSVTDDRGRERLEVHWVLPTGAGLTVGLPGMAGRPAA